MTYITRQLINLSLLICLSATVSAQTPAGPKPAPASVTVAVSQTNTGLRFTALGPVRQTRLEVFDAAGASIFDSGFLAGGVREWSPQQAGQTTPVDGTYQCVVTARDLAGRLSLKQGAVEVTSGQVALRLGEAAGPGEVERKQDALAPIGSESPALTITAHDGQDGHVVSTAGDLTLRTGDFFSGKDVERLRVTEDGRVGIGTDKPEATLDVAGQVRAREGFRFSDGTTLKAANGKLSVTNAAGDTVPGLKAAGTGTVNRLAKWQETGGAGTLTDAAAAETSGLTIFGQNASGQVAPLFPTAPTAHVLEVGATGTRSPLTLAGGSGVMEFWKDLGGGTGAPAAAVAFGMAKPGTASTNDMVFSTYLSGQPWNERMRLTSGGDLGIGLVPTAKLHVAGNVNFTGLRTEATASYPNVIGGASVNAVTANVVGATIAGGGKDETIFPHPPNRATDDYGTVGGGGGNRAGDDTGTTVGARYATVGGGAGNTAGYQFSTVGGGKQNNASNSYSTVGGGSSNVASGDHSTVSGGEFSFATNSHSTVGGGAVNIANGPNSTVGGGAGNIASGGYSTVPGGYQNEVQGDYSLAAGQRARAQHQGSFVWSDSTSTYPNYFTSTAADQFLINATGGVGIGTNAPGARLHVSGAGIIRARVNSDSNAGLALTLNNQPGWSVATVTGGHFQIYNDAVGQNAVWIDTASNNVGIGTTPAHKLHVNGTVAGVGPYVNASDLRYKRDIRTIDSALSKVLSLRGVTFDWRREEFPALDFATGRSVGFIAQEVERVVPEAVTRDAEGFRSVAYSHVTPVLVEAVKEQQKQITSQQQIITALRRQTVALEARLEALERAASISVQSPR